MPVVPLNERRSLVPFRVTGRFPDDGLKRKEQPRARASINIKMAANIALPAPFVGFSFLDLMETYPFPAGIIAAFLEPGSDRNALLDGCRGLADFKQAMHWSVRPTSNWP